MKYVIRILIISICVCVAFWPSVLEAEIILVPSEQVTIQNAVNVAQPCDTIQIAEGTYDGNINIIGKCLTILSETGRDNTFIIDSTNRCFYIHLCDSIVIKGLTLTGRSSSEGGAIFADSGTVSLHNSSIVNSRSNSKGGGIYALDMILTINSCEISTNMANDQMNSKGGGIYSENGLLIIDSCDIKGNTSSASDFQPGSFYNAGGGIYRLGDNLQISNSEISGNNCNPGDGGGGGIYCSGDKALLESCTILNNAASCGHKYLSGAYGGGIYFTGDSGIIINNNKFSLNSVSASAGNPSTIYGYGGGLYISGHNWLIMDNEFSDNSVVVNSPYGTCDGGASARGGGVYISGSNIFTRNLVMGNRVAAHGDNECGTNKSIISRGGGAYIGGAQEFEGNTFIGNKCVATFSNSWDVGSFQVQSHGGGYSGNVTSDSRYNVYVACSVSVSSSSLADTSNPSLTITEISGGAAIHSDSVTSCNIFHDNYGATDISGPGGTSNIFEDPYFYDINTGDYRPIGNSSCMAENNNCGVTFGAVTTASASMGLLAHLPAQNDINVFREQEFSVVFDTTMDTLTINASTFVVSGSISGTIDGIIRHNGSTSEAYFQPYSLLNVGEIVTVTLTTGIRLLSGPPIPSPYSWSFTIESLGGTGDYSYYEQLSAGSGPRGVAIADFDKDGFLDLAVVNDTSNEITIRLNNGNGTFANAVAFPNGGLRPHGIVAGDFDRNGSLDLATANYGNSSLMIYKNDGTGTFVSTGGYTTGSNPFDITAADFNGDGYIDLATCNEKVSGTVSIFLNDASGLGHFDPRIDHNTGSGPRSVYPLDLNDDGKIDLVTANIYDSTLSLLINDGSGTFTIGTTLSVRGMPEGVVANDFDGNGVVDIAAVNGPGVNDSYVTTFLNGASIGSDYLVDAYPRSIISLDATGDGLLDLATANWGSGSISLLANNGSGSFLSQSSFVFAPSAFSIRAADMDNDGDMDLVTANTNFRTVSIFYNKNQVPVDSTSPAPHSNNASPSDQLEVFFHDEMSSSTVIDEANFVVTGKSSGRHYGGISYNDASRIAIFVPSEPFMAGERVSVTLTRSMQTAIGDSLSKGYSWSFTVAASGGTGMFSDPFYYLVAGSKPNSIFSSDLNKDGFADLITADVDEPATPGTLSVFINNGQGGFNPAQGYNTDRFPYMVFATDFKNDGFTDLATPNWYANNTSVLFNNQDGTFGAPTNYPGNGLSSCISGADFDADGDNDLIVGNYSFATLTLYFNDGFGQFLTNQTLPSDSQPYFMIPSDLDNDGTIDIAVASRKMDAVSILKRDGTYFGPNYRSFAAGDAPLGLVARDFNSDGFVDLATANFNTSTVSILFNSGYGTFVKDTEYPVGANPHSLSTGDFNGDGQIDLVSANSADNSVTILYNDGTGVFDSSTTHAVGTTPSSVYASDLDNDGDIDVAVAHEISNNIAVLYNLSAPSFGEYSNVENIAPNTDAPLSAVIYGEPDSAAMMYRVGGNITWDTIQVSSTDSVYIGIIPRDSIYERSIEYFFEAYFMDITYQYPQIDLGDASLFLKISLTDNIVAGVILNGYQMIGFPYDIEPNTPQSVFEDDLGSYNIENWRYGRWNTSTGQYDEYPSIGLVQNSRGYWLYTRNIATVDASGFSSLPDREVLGIWYKSISVEAGYNQISAPFIFPISWADRRVYGTTISSSLWEYSSGGYIQASTLEPYKGYFLFSDGTGILDLPYIESASKNEGIKKIKAPDIENWFVKLELRSGLHTDYHNYLGVTETAHNSIGIEDIREPPIPPGNFISLASVDKTTDRLLACDYRTSSDVVEFDLNLRGNIQSDVFLTVSSESRLPDGYEVRLVDRANGQVENLTEKPSIELNIPLTLTGYPFSLMVGKPSAIDSIAVSPTIPGSYELYQNFPNPFNPSTFIKFDLPENAFVELDVFNITGQMVRRIVSRELQAGQYHFSWDGKNHLGHAVPSGIYIYRLSSDQYVSSKKLVLLK